MSKIHINIGSNIGDRAAQIERAVALLAARLDPEGRAEVKLAPIVESEPWGFNSPYRFLNVGMMIDTPEKQIDPHKLLATLQNIEREIAPASHRNNDGSYADRKIDIDLIAIDDMIVDSENLQLPHSRMASRRFVIEPLSILDPTWRHPQTGMTACELLACL